MNERGVISVAVEYAQAILAGLRSYDPGPLSGWFFFAVVLAIFIAPGYWLVGWLHRRLPRDHLFQIVLGFAWSFAVFAPVAWPFLWLGGSFFAFLCAIGVVWAGFLLGSAYLYYRDMPNRGDIASATAKGPMAVPALPECGVGLAMVSLHLLTALALLAAAWQLRNRDLPFSHPDVRELASRLAFFFAAAIVFALVGRLLLHRALAFSSDDDERPSRLSIGLASAFVALQTASAMFFDRPDWDDCFYLAAVLDYEHADVLNAEEPTHREGFPMQAFDRLLAWELWGAVLCRLTGLNPMAVFHTLLPAFLIPAAYLAYARLLGTVVPRRWVPLALMAVAAYHLWGVASHNTPANFLLNRTAQGKCVLLHVAIPLIVVLQLRFVGSVSWANWGSLCAGVVFGLAASSTAVFLLPMLLACLGVALAPMLIFPSQGGVAAHDTPRAKRFAHLGLAALGSAAALLPPIAYGLLIRREVLGDPMIVDPDLIPLWEKHYTWFHEVGGHIHSGTWEILWLLLTPMTALLLWTYRRLAYPVVFPGILLLTFSNPWLFHVVAQHLTSYPTYFRVFWLYPVQAGLGVFLALTARLAARSAWAGWLTWGAGGGENRQPALAQRSMPRSLDWLATAVAVVLVGLSLWLPALYVWGPVNVGMIHAHKGGPRNPPVVDNVLKMPRDLVAVADILLTDPDIRRHRILAIEPATNFLTPYSREYRFVQTRTLYTLGMSDMAGRYDEGEKRYLVSLLLEPHFQFQDWSHAPYYEWHPYYRARGPVPRTPVLLTRQMMRELCDELRVRYAVTHSLDQPDFDTVITWNLRQVGFSEWATIGEFTLWLRDLPEIE